MSYINTHKAPSFMEKLIAAGSYVYPIVGFVIVIISAVMKTRLKPFLQYHIFQSIFIAFAIVIIVYGLNITMNILSAIPIVKNIVMLTTFYLTMKLFWGLSIITFVKYIFFAYIILGVIMGSYSYVPWVSDIIKANLKGQL